MQKSDNFSLLVNHLKNGDICIFDTDTVVGIGCAVQIIKFGKTLWNNQGYNRIFDIKSRGKTKKLPWLINSYKMLDTYTTKIPENIENFIQSKWPGKYTFILPAKSSVHTEFISFNNEQATLAFRIPDVDFIRDAIDELKCPLFCTSANISGKPPANRLYDVDDLIYSKVDFIFSKNANKNTLSKPSQIFDCTDMSPVRKR